MSPATAIVFVVDDDISVRESLELLILSGGWQPETFASAQQFLGRPRAVVPSCLVLDVSLPGLNGLELQERIGVERSDMPIIFVTGHGNVPMTVRAMKAGAVEFLTKPFSEDALLNAIRLALKRSESALVRERELHVFREAYASLTPREREVMRLVVSGLLNKQVGAELGISEITVKAHRGSLMRKMKGRFASRPGAYGRETWTAIRFPDKGTGGNRYLRLIDSRPSFWLNRNRSRSALWQPPIFHNCTEPNAAWKNSAFNSRLRQPRLALTSKHYRQAICSS